MKAKFRVIGVNKETADDVDLVIEAATAANARVKAQLAGHVVTEVLELDLEGRPIEPDAAPEAVGVSSKTTGSEDEPMGLDEKTDRSAPVGFAAPSPSPASISAPSSRARGLAPPQSVVVPSARPNGRKAADADGGERESWTAPPISTPKPRPLSEPPPPQPWRPQRHRFVITRRDRGLGFNEKIFVNTEDITAEVASLEKSGVTIVRVDPLRIHRLRTYGRPAIAAAIVLALVAGGWAVLQRIDSSTPPVPPNPSGISAEDWHFGDTGADGVGQTPISTQREMRSVLGEDYWRDGENEDGSATASAARPASSAASRDSEASRDEDASPGGLLDIQQRIEARRRAKEKEKEKEKPVNLFDLAVPSFKSPSGK